MKLFILIVALLFNILLVTGVKEIFLNEFPPLYEFDDYDNCLDHRTSTLFSGTYCMVYSEIQPQNSSKLWKKIVQYSTNKFHYRRDRLFFGVCVERCKNAQLHHYSENNHTRINNKITKLFDMVHKRPLDLQMRFEYHDLLHNCLNLEFQAKYDLKLKTYIEYCENKEMNSERDELEKILFKVLEIILILNILSTLYDYCLKRQQPFEEQNENFYKINPQQSVSRLLTAFSIRRNYYRLTEPCNTALGRNLNYLDGVRTLTMLIVICGHVYFAQYHHVKNPEIFEQFTKSSMHLWLTNGTLLLEVFHVMSGMLLCIKFKEYMIITPLSSFKECLKIFVKGIVMRYVRFFPSLVLFLFVNATIFTRLQDGPFWRHITEPSRVFSREKWWKNLFMINNSNENGFPHTWYMTTDCQLFAFYFGILILIEKYPKYKNRIFVSLAFLSFAIPFCVSYILKIEPCFLLSPESYRFIRVKEEDRAYYNLYTPFYTNMGGYLVGIICGEIYLYYNSNEKIYQHTSRIPKALYELVFWSCLALGVWICWLGALVIFQNPSIFTALYAGLNRNLWASVVVGIPIILCTFCKSLWILNVFCSSVCRFMARLSFQIYLWHFPIIYILNGYKRQPIFNNHLHHTNLTIEMLAFSISLAFIIAILYEYPCHRAVTYYYKKEILIKPHHLKS